MNAMPKEWRREQDGPAPIDILTARAEARAYLYAIGELELVEAVDPLEEYAHASGLVRTIGQDAVQAVIAAAFEPFREAVYV